MSYLFHILLTQPLFNILIFFYNTIAFRDLGIAIILLTIFIRIILFPVFRKSMRYQAMMQIVQPKLKAIQEKHKNDRTKQTEAMLALYKEHNVNPFSGILLLFAQLPILLVLYRIFLRYLTPAAFTNLYPFVHAPSTLNTSFLGLINLGEASILMVAFAAIAQYFQGKLSLPKRAPGEAPTQAERMGRQMIFIGPLLTILIFWRLPSAVGLYWLASSLFSIGQQIIINKEIALWKTQNPLFKKS